MFPHAGIRCVANSLELTFDYLATTENEAATAVLLAALDHPEPSVAEGALRALLRRKSPEALEELVRRWHRIGERWKEIIAERPGILTTAIKNAFRSSNEQLVRNAADAAVAVSDYDLIALFGAAVSDSQHFKRQLAAEALLHFGELLYDELHGTQRGRVRRDAQAVRQFVCGYLESPAAKWAEHQSPEVLEAFLLVASRDNATLRHLLQDTHEPSHEPLCEQLLRSTRPGVMRLLLSFLDDAHAPIAAIRLIGRRGDLGFFRLLCRKLVEDHSPHLEPNLARIAALGWIDDNLALVDALEESEQPGAVTLVWRAKIEAKQKRRMLQYLLKIGKPRGRQAAARALLDVMGSDADVFLLRFLHDDCPLVQAEAARQLRPRDVPNALSMLIDLLDSPYSEVRAAARESLEEFTFARYLTAFDTLTPEVRRATGAIVQRVSPNLAEELVMEMMASGRARRMRAMHIATVLGVVPEMEFGLIELCRDEDQAVRLEAVRLLGQCPSQEVRRTLRELLTDPSMAIQHMAEQSLHDMTMIDPNQSTLFGSRWAGFDRDEVPQ
jgi:HEAT repeat protein